MKKKFVLTLKMIGIALALIFVYRCLGGEETLKQGDRKSNELLRYGENTSYSFSMGTAVTVSIYENVKDYTENSSDSVLESVSIDEEVTKVEQSISDLDKKLIAWREENSELGRVNAQYEAKKPIELSDELYIALKLSYEVCEKTDGALDITIRPLAKCWNIEEATPEDFVVPDRDKVNEALKKVDYRQISVNDHKIVFEKSGMTLDLGAVGKGYALDITREILKKDGVSGAVISVGGSILVYGKKPDGQGFRVGVRNPKGNQEDMIGYLEFEPGSSTCISTSGDYEKYIEMDGVKYHHILDSKTGYPVENELSSVTVVCENGLYSDALSTACYALGEEKARKILPAFEAEAVFIDKENHVSVTDGLKNCWILNH